MLKEDGYDEYLSEQVRLGLEDISAGRVISLEEAEKEWQQIIEQKTAEMALLDKELKNELYA